MVVEKDWEKVRDGLINRPDPQLRLSLQSSSRGRRLPARGEIYLKHCYEEMELDVHYLEKTLPYVYLLWGRPVHLETLSKARRLFSVMTARKIAAADFPAGFPALMWNYNMSSFAHLICGGV